ncbi:MAG: PIN domain-containing protein [Thermoanaerobaculia bacterium]
MTGLLDTAVLVDLLRTYPPASAWLASQDRLGVSPIVWLEIIDGAENARAQTRAVELLRHFDKVEILPADFDWAIRQALRFRLSHNVDMMDSLIASTAQRLGVPLFTPNLKHFQPMIGTLAKKPY